MIDFARIFGPKDSITVTHWPFKPGEIILIHEKPVPIFARVLADPKDSRVQLRLLGPLGLWFYQDFLPFLKGRP